MDAIRIPGHCTCCRNCRHRTGEPSHVNPCDLVRWENNRQVGPSLVDRWYGPECGDFVAMESPPATWTPRAPEPAQPT